MVLPGMLGKGKRGGARKAGARLDWDRELCTLCGGCAPLCPSGAITVYETYLDIARERCTACGACPPGCPSGALRIAGGRSR